jgi:quinol monooxygenase YgiN
MSYVVTVVFVAKPEFRARFRQEMIANATASREREPGCRQFDVCESGDGAEIFLYEVYDDEAAFQAHLVTDHYKRFNETVTPWVEVKRIIKFKRVSPA